MKNVWIAFLGIFLSLCCYAEPTRALWMNSSIKSIKVADHMSRDDEGYCQNAILNEVNHRLKTSFTLNDLAPIQMPGWPEPVMGFMRGGGYNIRIVGSVDRTSHQATHIKPGRFSDFETIVKLGAQPSLHIPKDIEGHAVFIKTESADQVQFDFVAHSDTGYAYLPIGVFIHGFRDVLGSKERSPCPVEPEHEM